LKLERENKRRNDKETPPQKPVSTLRLTNALRGSGGVSFSNQKTKEGIMEKKIIERGQELRRSPQPHSNPPQNIYKIFTSPAQSKETPPRGMIIMCVFSRLLTAG
jgi:hypothetical protein